MLHDLPLCARIEVDVYTWLALVSAFGGDEHKISLPQQQPYFADGPVLHENPRRHAEMLLGLAAPQAITTLSSNRLCI